MGNRGIGISEAIQNLKEEMSNAVIGACAEVAGRSLDEMKTIQENQLFWENRTGEALDSIGSEIDIEGDNIAIKVGFKKNRPKETNTDRQKEYDKYLAEYKGGIGGAGNMFLGQSLSILTRNFSDIIPEIAHKAKRASFDRESKKWSFEK